MPEQKRPFVTPHALRAYQKHHPDATWQDAISAWEMGTRMAADLVRTLCGRIQSQQRYTQRSFYRLAPDRRGIFVVVHNEDPHRFTVVTYLRLGGTQQDYVRNRFPHAEYEAQRCPGWFEVLGAPLSAIKPHSDIVREYRSKPAARQAIAKFHCLFKDFNHETQEETCLLEDGAGILFEARIHPSGPTKVFVQHVPEKDKTNT